MAVWCLSGCWVKLQQEGTQLGQLIPSDQRDILYSMTTCSAIKFQGKEEERIMVVVFPSHCYTY